MKVKIFKEQDTDLMEHKLNKFDDEHNVKFTQHSYSDGTIVAVVFYEVDK